jgi:hypothetical protein
MVKRLKRFNFQYLEEKAVACIAHLYMRYFNIASRLTLLKLMLTCQTIYPLTALHVSVEPLQSVLKFIRSFFWAGTEQAMDKFSSPLRLRWPWLAWTLPDRPCVGMENPCNKHDMELFYAFTSVTMGNGIKVFFFWEDPWVDGVSPKVLGPSIYAISRQKT